MATNTHVARAVAVLRASCHKLQRHLRSAHCVLVAWITVCAPFCAALLEQHPWLRALRNAACHFAAFLIGSTFEDERVAFSKPALVKNDSYRDRLLVAEIADLVDLSEALRLSIAQRKALFQCFLHLDCMRRAGVTRTELLRYCDLRVTPLACFLLPESSDGATHRSGMTQRWDILQWLAVCFSVCTLEFDTDDLAVPEEQEHERATSPKQQTAVESKPVPVVEELGICDQLSRCFEFFIGVPNAHECHLQSLLLEFYSHGQRTSRDRSQRTTTLDFRQVHGVASILDVAKLFPVLQRRILGPSTWQVLQQRRRELRLVGMDANFLAFPDIITAAHVHVHRKKNQQQQQQNSSATQWWKLSSAWSRVRYGRGREPERERGDLARLVKASSGSESRLSSTPRKILPSVGVSAATAKSSTDEPAHDVAKEDAQKLNLQALSVSNADEAWRVTANHAIASLHVDMSLAKQSSSTSDEGSSIEHARGLFQSTAKEVRDGKLAPEACEAVRKTLVHAFGYQFTRFLFAKSSLCDVSSASKASVEGKRSQQRYAKAWASLKSPEDKSCYWKQFSDPATRRAFYYNIRTGESRWERPANFVSRKKPRAGKKSKTKAKAT